MIAAKRVQQALADKGLLSTAELDGTIGPKTHAAIDAALAGAGLELGLRTWAPDRKLIAFQQWMARDADLRQE